MNSEAMRIPKSKLLVELQVRIERKNERQAAIDSRMGSKRIRIASYMENLGWPELFGYDMNRYLEDPSFCCEQELRQRIFWMDNVDDDMRVKYPGLKTIVCKYGQRLIVKRR